MSVRTICLICGASYVPRTLRMTLPDIDTKERFSLVECPSCSVLRTLPVPHDLTPYYGLDMGRMMVAQPSAAYASIKRILLKQELRRIRKHVDPHTFIDVGSGVGDFAGMIHANGFQVITVDGGKEKPLTTRNFPDVPHYRISYDTYEIPGLDNSAERAVVLRHVLEHIRDPHRFLNRMVDYGAAYFYVVVPNAACAERHLLGQFWSLWDPPRHLWHFNAIALGRLFRTLRMDVVATGRDTIPGIVPSLYRLLRLRGWPPAFCDRFNPKGALSALSAPLNFLLPGNVLWAVVKVAPS